MAEKIVTTKIDEKANTVTLEGEQGLTFPTSFEVKGGDTLKWKLQGLTAGATARVRVLRPGTPLLKKGNTLDGTGAVIDGGAVDAGAADGEYPYEVFLLTATGEKKLTCLWSDGKAAPKKAPGLAPGRKGGGD
jgi:hypothetical protein